MNHTYQTLNREGLSETKTGGKGKSAYIKFSLHTHTHTRIKLKCKQQIRTAQTQWVAVLKQP